MESFYTDFTCELYVDQDEPVLKREVDRYHLRFPSGQILASSSKGLAGAEALVKQHDDISI